MRAAEPTFYDVLGVAPTATGSEIEAAWKALVRKHHPDRVDGPEKDIATARTAAINEAYQALRRPAMRARYDRSVLSGRDTRLRRVDSDEALEALLRLRRQRHTERFRVGGAAALGIAALAYTARALKWL